MTNKTLIDFLKGAGPDKHGRTIYDIWNYSDEKLESVHNYIQWLFPLPEPSEQVLGSPYLENEEEIKVINADLEIQENIIKSLLRMEEFYRENDFWLQPNDHNHMRITRIIKSVGLLSSKENAKDFYTFIMNRVEKFKPVTEESLDFWEKAIQK